ncbi:molybdate transport system substrate-binding protein [Tamaricihabitans halophyticus]|uniref:Molybdate transport system substrate-binding protein n=1 Tax=Tamaricihabitans halophyticus TaxID=1262583 RepID=A0A4R2R3G6_9PSEU|nr:molybdate ABC transporter substrate-binding protein [Tamaricihabitans halophyticus]TCP56567.1 molybdate transport system substrate-binding protein [Tamaricihabitans halophyticus]
MNPRPARAMAGILAGMLVLAGCTGSAESANTLTVLAAASLTETFGELEKRFEQEHPDVDVRISYDGSSTLAQQAINGASADVFASADPENMTKVVDAGAVDGQPAPFATNKLTIAVAKGNSKGIQDLRGLTAAGLTVVGCAEEVPCGRATAEVQRAASVTLRLASEEQSVKAVLNKVQAGEADAGLVYVTDVRAAGDAVTGVSFPEADQVINEYPIARLADAPNPELAAEFVELVRGQEGGRVLTDAGFGRP